MLRHRLRFKTLRAAYLVATSESTSNLSNESDLCGELVESVHFAYELAALVYWLN